jgi:hypothetical protein
MRSKWWLILLVIFLGVSFSRVSLSWASSQAQKKQRPAQPAPQRPAEKSDDMVDGFGPNAIAARDRALEHAQERVEELLLKRFAETGWKPAPEQLTADYLLHYGVVQPQGEPTRAKGLNDERAMVARYKVQLTPEYLHEVQRIAREQRVQERHLVLARVLGGLVVLLLVVAGYLRLEDMTRGYATQMLRLVAVGLVALAAAVLWLTK